MTEKDVLGLAQVELLKIYPGAVIWRSPAFKHMRWDIFTIFDIVLVTPLGQVIFIQCTTDQHLSDRRKKINSFYSYNHFNIPNSYIWAWSKLKNKFIIEKI